MKRALSVVVTFTIMMPFATRVVGYVEFGSFLQSYEANFVRHNVSVRAVSFKTPANATRVYCEWDNIRGRVARDSQLPEVKSNVAGNTPVTEWSNSAQTAADIEALAVPFNSTLGKFLTAVAEATIADGVTPIVLHAPPKSHASIESKVKRDVAEADELTEVASIRKMGDVIRATITVDLPSEMPVVARALQAEASEADYVLGLRRINRFDSIEVSAAENPSGYVGIHYKLWFADVETETNMIGEVQLHYSRVFDGPPTDVGSNPKEYTHKTWYEPFRDYADGLTPEENEQINPAQALVFAMGMNAVASYPSSPASPSAYCDFETGSSPSAARRRLTDTSTKYWYDDGMLFRTQGDEAPLAVYDGFTSGFRVVNNVEVLYDATTSSVLLTDAEGDAFIAQLAGSTSGSGSSGSMPAMAAPALVIAIGMQICAVVALESHSP